MLELEKLLPKKVPVRKLRVAETIKKIVANILTQQEIDSEIISNNFITVSKVTISPDLHNATIYITVLQSTNIKELLAELNKLSPKFRFLISKNLKLKTSPQVIFKFDDTLEEVERINKLLMES